MKPMLHNEGTVVFIAKMVSRGGVTSLEGNDAAPQIYFYLTS